MANPKIGLALSGGTARGFGHIAVLEAMDDVGVKPDWITGCSMGALIGCGYAAGMTGREIRDYCLEIFSDSGSAFQKFWQARPKKLGDLFSLGGLNPAQINAVETITIFMPEQVPSTFEELRIPFTATASDYYDPKPIHMESGDVRTAVAASIAIPFIFSPVYRQDEKPEAPGAEKQTRCLIDGGVTCPLPVQPLEGRADKIIAVGAIGEPLPSKGEVPGAWEVLIGASQGLQLALINEALKERPADLVIKLPLDTFNAFDFFKVRSMLKVAEKGLPDLRRQIEAIAK